MKGLTTTISIEDNHKQCSIFFICITLFPYNDIAMKDRLLNINLHFEAVKHILALITFHKM